MNLKELQKHIRTLATLPEAGGRPAGGAKAMSHRAREMGEAASLRATAFKGDA